MKEARLCWTRQLIDSFPFRVGVQTAESWYIRLAFGDSVEVLGEQTTLSHGFNVTHKILRQTNAKDL